MVQSLLAAIIVGEVEKLLGVCEQGVGISGVDTPVGDGSCSEGGSRPGGQVRPLKNQRKVLVLWGRKLKMKCLESREFFNCLRNEGGRNEGGEDTWRVGCWFSFMCERKNMMQVYRVSKCRSCRQVLASLCLLDVPSKRGPNFPGPLVRRNLLWPTRLYEAVRGPFTSFAAIVLSFCKHWLSTAHVSYTWERPKRCILFSLIYSN